MNAQDKATHVIRQQVINDILYRLSLLIDDIQFSYAAHDNTNRPAISQHEDPEDEDDDDDDDDDGTPWDDDLPFV